MSLLISASQISKSMGHRSLFQDLSFGVSENERIGLLGSNGAGKSTLLKILSGLDQPDEGDITSRKNLRMAFVRQEENFDENLSVLQNAVNELTRLGMDPHEAEIQGSIQLSMVGFENFEQAVAQISGGWRKRLNLAIAFAQEPDLLLLDEPTNHMDWDGILWLEDHLKSFPGSFILVSHDRQFLNHQCNKIMEINRLYKKGFLAFDGNYDQFLEKKNEYIVAQQSLESSMSNKARRETEWLRAGVKARTTKSQSRIKEAHQLIDDLDEVKQRNLAGRQRLRMEIDHSGRLSKKLIELKSVRLAFDDHLLIENLNFLMGPKTCLGLLGENGSGKTTLLKAIADQLPINSGEIFRADGLKIVYFDQKREDLPKDKNIMEYLGGGADHVVFRNESVHVASYASRFLFSSDRMQLPIRQLSGGEQARLLIAKLLLNPADVLILDEPTNDLDIESIEILEDTIASFPGLTLLVSHDRYFMDVACHKFLSLDGAGAWSEFPDLNQWLKRRKKKEVTPASTPKAQTPESQPKKQSKYKLSYKEKRQMETIEQDIEAAEQELSEAQAQIEDEKVFSDHEKMQKALAHLKEKQEQVDKLYAFWDDIEQKTTPS